MLLAGTAKLPLGGLGLVIGVGLHASFLAAVVLATKLRGSS